MSFWKILIVNSKMNSWILPSITFTLKDNNPEILDFTLKHLRALNEACTFPFTKKSSHKNKICFQDMLPHSSPQFTAMLGILRLLCRSGKGNQSPLKPKHSLTSGSVKLYYTNSYFCDSESQASTVTLQNCYAHKIHSRHFLLHLLFCILNLIFASCKLK